MTQMKKPFKNFVAKEEHAFNQHFSHKVFCPRKKKQHSSNIGFVVCKCFKFGPCKKCHLVNPFPNKPWFLRVCCISLMKTLWEKEKLLVTSNFSFSHSVF